MKVDNSSNTTVEEFMAFLKGKPKKAKVYVCDDKVMLGTYNIAVTEGVIEAYGEHEDEL